MDVKDGCRCLRRWIDCSVLDVVLSKRGNVVIEIYTSRYCPYCREAKRLLASKAARFREIDIAANSENVEEMVSRSGGESTVPQVFINGRHVGDMRTLRELDRIGELDRILAQ